MWNDLTKEQKNERTRKRLRVKVDESNYFFYPETVQTDSFRIDQYQRVAVYARVSTDSSSQASSFELQQTYYEEFVQKHDKWELVKIYADKGISGTSLKHRDAFNEMMADAKAGKIDLIITKSVSRFARNAKDFLDAVRDLAEHYPPIGVFFESENIYSLRTDMEVCQSVPSLSQAQRMKSYSQQGKLTGDVMGEIMHDEKEPTLDKVILPGEKIRKFFPRSYTLEQIEQVIISLLESWCRSQALPDDHYSN